MTSNVESSIKAARFHRAVLAVAMVAASFISIGAFAGPASAESARRGDIANSVLSLLNAQRKANKLPPLRMNAKLIISANAHNNAMITANTMAHQVQSEPGFVQRIKTVKYKWRVAGENIGFNTDTSVNGVLALEWTMYNEVAPHNGHRLNILNRGYREIGIDVVVDSATGKVWLTEDFGRAR